MIDWVHFGSSGHIEQPENVVQSFLYRGEYSSKHNGPNGRYNSHKSVVKTDKPVVFGVHIHQYDGSTIGRNVSFTEDPENPDFLVNHYAIQSLNFWINVKMTRGDVNYYYDAMGWNRNRKLFDEMDVPTRQSYVMSIVPEGERDVMAATNNLGRGIGRLPSTTVTGALWASSISVAPWITAAGLKLTYNLAVYMAFRGVRPPEES